MFTRATPLLLLAASCSSAPLMHPPETSRAGETVDDVGLCPITPSDEVVQIDREPDHVVVTVTTRDASKVEDLYARATDMSQRGRYEADVDVRALPDGVRLTFTPLDPTDTEALAREIESDGHLLSRAHCEPRRGEAIVNAR